MEASLLTVFQFLAVRETPSAFPVAAASFDRPTLPVRINVKPH